MTRGTARRVRIESAADLAQMINGCTPRNAYTGGRLRDGLPDQVEIVIAAKEGSDPRVVARTKQNFIFAEGEPGVGLFDFDPKGCPDDVRQRIAAAGGPEGALAEVLPAIEHAACVTRASTSSGSCEPGDRRSLSWLRRLSHRGSRARRR